MMKVISKHPQVVKLLQLYTQLALYVWKCVYFAFLFSRQNPIITIGIEKGVSGHHHNCVIIVYTVVMLGL